MKNHFTTSIINLLFGLCFASLTPLIAESQIVSSPGGGLWSSGSTWVGGIVPGAADNVVIASTVNVNNNNNACNNINITSAGILRNHSASHYTLTVNGNFTNEGTVTNNVGYTFNLNVIGNVTNNGTMTNNALTLSGSGDQQLASTQPLAISNFTKNQTSGRAIATTGLNFVGTNITLGSDTLEFTTGNFLTISGGYLSTGVIYKSSLPALQITSGNGTYAFSLTIDAFQSELYGDLRIYGNSNVFKKNVINFGTLQNSQASNYTLSVNGNFTNNGTVKNNVINFTVNVSGNLTNNGTWTSYSAVLNGTGNQLLAMTQPFSGSNFSKTVSAGRVIATTGLNFVGTSIDLNLDTLEFSTGNTISINGGFLSNCVLYKASLPAIQLTSGNGAYVYMVTIDAPQTELYGNLRIFGSNSVFKTNIINSGILQNRENTNYTLTVNGSFTNNGTVKNNVTNFYLNVSGNLTNNGTWTNYSTTLNGSGNKELALSQPFGGLYFSKTASAGRAIATAGLSFVGTNIDFNADTLEFTTGNSISFVGGSLNNSVLFKTSMPALQISSGNGAYVYIVTIDAPQTELYGDVRIFGSGSVFKTNVVNSGILQNRPNSSYSLTVNGSFANNGFIQNNIFNFSLNISGNVTNDGTWINYQTTLTGTNTHSIAFSNRFEGDLFTNGNAAAGMISTTDLIFDGTTVNLSGCSFALASGSRLSVLNGGINNAVISGTDIRFHSLGAYCTGVIFNSGITLQGVFQAGSGVGFNGSIVNEGVMRNRGISSYGIQVQGGIENNGSITNNLFNFTITVLGDIHNNGVWSNYLTILDGATDQNIFLINGSSIQSQIRLEANFTGSTFAWWGPQGNLVGNAGFTGASSQILNFLNPVTDAYAGQYYCVNNTGVHSRNVFIQSQLNPVRVLTMNLLLEGLYDSNGIMNPSRDASGAPVWNSNVADQITVELHDISNFSNIVFAKEEVLLSTNGVVTFAVPAAYSSSYFIAIRHRSGIITISATPVPFTTPQVDYSFDIAGKAFGNNMALMPDGWYALYGGDVNQDGIVDTADMTPVDNGSAAYLSGYRNPDANGDGIIDTADMTLVDNNSANYVSAVYP